MAGILVEPVELEVAVIVRRRHRNASAILDELDAGAFDAVDNAILLPGNRAADEAFGVAPQVAVIAPRFCAKLGLHPFEPLVADEPRHFVVLELERAHGAGRAGLLAAGLLPALIDEMGIEGP